MGIVDWNPMARSRIVALENLQQFTALNVLSDPGVIPGPITAPLCMQVRIRFTLPGGKVGFIVSHARYTTAFPGTVAMANALLTAFQALYSANAMFTFMPSTAALAGVDLRDINVVDQPIITSTGAASPGTSAGVALPTETAICLTLRTAKTGPANRGRMYLPGFAVNATEAGGTIAAALMTNLGNVAGGWRSVYSGQGLTQCIAQPARAAYTGSTGRQHPARDRATQDVTSVEIRDNHWDSQRRRGLK